MTLVNGGVRRFNPQGDEAGGEYKYRNVGEDPEGDPATRQSQAKLDAKPVQQHVVSVEVIHRRAMCLRKAKPSSMQRPCSSMLREVPGDTPRISLQTWGRCKDAQSYARKAESR